MSVYLLVDLLVNIQKCDANHEIYLWLFKFIIEMINLKLIHNVTQLAKVLQPFLLADKHVM